MFAFPHQYVSRIVASQNRKQLGQRQWNISQKENANGGIVRADSQLNGEAEKEINGADEERK